MGKMTMKNKATLKKIKDDGATAVIRVDTEIEIGEADEDDPMGGMVEITEAKSQAEVLWDLKNGRLTSMKTTMTLTMEVMGQEIEMEMKMHLKLRKSRKDVPSEDKDRKKKERDDY